MSPVTPELALVDPALAELEREQIATRLDGWLARTEWRMPAPAPPPRNARRTVMTVVLLASMLANGLLTSFLLFGRHEGATIQPAAPPPTLSASLADEAAKVMNIPPPNPSLPPRTHSK